jgi:hypothetical protein
MVLYKYRSLQNLTQVLDIIINSRLYCSKYLDLNDPFEGLFSGTIHIPYKDRIKFPFFILPESLTVTKSVKDLFYDSKDRERICSLSSSISDVRLWAQYADGNRGIALKIDFSGLDNFIHEVVYSTELSSYGITLLTSPNPIEVLTMKTIHWSYESEFRIIHEGEYFDITDRLKEIYVGHRVSEFHLALLEKLKPSEVKIIHTEIDPKKIEVRIRQKTYRNESRSN